MKFACDQCKTKYSIADERVRGKVLKIRCKHCSHVITVREEAAPRGRERGALERAMDQALAVPPSASFHGSDATLVATPDALLGPRGEPPPLDPEEWHLSIDGQAHGPLRLEALAQRIILERAAGDQELYVWRDGFDDWQPPREVPEVRVAVERLRPGLPSTFWGTPEPLFKAQAARGGAISTHPVDRVDAFEFENEPPTLAVRGKAAAAVVQKVQQAPRAGSGEGARPLQGVAAAPSPGPPGSGPAAGAIPSARPSPPPESVTEALAHLDDDLPPGAGPSRSAPPPLPWLAQAADDGGHELHISEPSQMIDLRTLAGAVMPEAAPAPELPGLDLPPAPPQVLVMPGPAPAHPERRLKVVLGAALGACALLTALVAYLLLRKPADRPPGDRAADGKAVTDRPVLVQDEGVGKRVGEPAGDAKKGPGAPGGAAKRPLKLPAAASGKTQLNGNAQALAKLYEEGGERAPPLPGGGSAAAAGGGGVSTAELQEVMRRNQKSLSVCYDRLLKHDESLRRARIDVQVRIGISGTVTHVTIAPPYGGTELGQCMQQTIRRWRFPPSDSDYETQFPLILTAN